MQFTAKSPFPRKFEKRSLKFRRNLIKNFITSMIFILNVSAELIIMCFRNFRCIYFQSSLIEKCWDTLWLDVCVTILLSWRSLAALYVSRPVYTRRPSTTSLWQQFSLELCLQDKRLIRSSSFSPAQYRGTKFSTFPLLSISRTFHVTTLILLLVFIFVFKAVPSRRYELETILNCDILYHVGANEQQSSEEFFGE